MSDKRDAMIASLTAYDEVSPGNVTDTEDGGTGLFDGEDKLLDEIPPIEAVPPGVVDEQEEVFEQARTESEQPEQGQSSGSDDVDESVDWKRAAEGRRAEITTLRSKLSEQSQNIEQLRQMWLAEAQEKAAQRREQDRIKELEKEAELYGEDVVNDPATRYMRDKLAQTQEMLERQSQAEEARRRSVQEQAQQYRAERAAQEQALESLRHMETEFEQKVPDYKQAYDFAVKKRADMWQKRGYSPAEAEQAVRNEEAYLFAEQMQLGNNPAKVAYDMAIEWGWNPEMAQTEQQPAPGPNSQKMRAGVQAGGVRSMPGTAGNANASANDYITAEQFFKTVPDAVRMRVLGDPDKFEELGRTGKIKRDW